MVPLPTLALAIEMTIEVGLRVARDCASDLSDSADDLSGCAGNLGSCDVGIAELDKTVDEIQNEREDRRVRNSRKAKKVSYNVL